MEIIEAPTLIIETMPPVGCPAVLGSGSRDICFCNCSSETWGIRAGEGWVAGDLQSQGLRQGPDIVILCTDHTFRAVGFLQARTESDLRLSAASLLRLERPR